MWNSRCASLKIISWTRFIGRHCRWNISIHRLSNSFFQRKSIKRCSNSSYITRRTIILRSRRYLMKTVVSLVSAKWRMKIVMKYRWHSNNRWFMMVRIHRSLIRSICCLLTRIWTKCSTTNISSSIATRYRVIANLWESRI